MGNPHGELERREWRTAGELWEKLKPLAQQKRKEPTSAEMKLWSMLRGKGLEGNRFRRQHSIERFIVDFFCSSAKLIIEVDGGYHDYTVQEDAIRQEFLEAQGFQILRFKNEEVLRNIETVLNKIRLALNAPVPTGPPSLKSGRGTGGGVD